MKRQIRGLDAWIEDLQLATTTTGLWSLPIRWAMDGMPAHIAQSATSDNTISGRSTG